MSNINFSHTSVLLFECIEALNIRDGYTYIDCTAGGGGHSLEIAKRMGKNSRLICFDRDKNAIAAASERLKDYKDQVTFINDNFSSIGKVVKELGITNLGGVLADLGCSSHQFDTPIRGFSYMHDAPLDMRMDTDAPLSAYEVVNEYSEQRLKKLIFDYGEERFAPRIAAAICRHRELSPIKTTHELTDIIKGAIPAAARADGPHPAKRTFQAIRIEVNGELVHLERALESAFNVLKPGGKLAIITFHSLEDGMVKRKYKEWCKGCTCPKDFPICVCGNTPKAKMTPSKAIEPSALEQQENPRSKSARLRVLEKL
jgi:16S rRNA (cytosine1402-N4)-methyltransferase